ncbi:MAG: polyprenyl synthetase family protein [Pyrinomonadaceae bacterium]
MTDVKQFFEQVRRDVDSTLDALLPADSVEPVKLHRAIRWSVFAGGKRIRPALVYAAGAVFGADREGLANTAAAVEMIHAYSLIHDDLPAMDDDDLRRGKATCHKQFGEATAILAGDVLQTLAFKAISEDENLAPEVRIALISLLASASGTPDGMVSGQQLDLDGEDEDLSIEKIEKIHTQKTGALIRAAACAGALIGSAAPVELAAIDSFAANLGLLFQVSDDVLDVSQGTDALGKTAGKDESARKSTYVSHYGLEKARDIVSALLEAAIKPLTAIQRDTTILNKLAASIAQRTK